MVIIRRVCKRKVETELQPSAQLLTQVVQTKYLKVGESVSYGSTFTATEDIKSQFCQLDMQMVTYAQCKGHLLMSKAINVKS